MNGIVKFDLVIVGGGMVGLSLACALKDSGLKIALVERQELSQLDSLNPKQGGLIEPRSIDDFDLRVSAISPANQLWLQQIGGWQNIDQSRVTDYLAMEVWDGNSQGLIRFDCDECAEPKLGSIVENRQLQAGLYKALNNQRHLTIVEASIEALGLTANGATIQLSNHDEIEAKLVVGADGAFSKIRELANIKVEQTPYEQNALVANIICKKPHQQTAWQRFSATGPLALLPLPDPHWCSIVWSQDAATADQLMALESEQFEQRLTIAAENKLGQLKLASKLAAFPLVKRHSQTYLAPGLVLIGDAAHTIHPLAGQGVNIGFADAKLLAETIIHRWSQQNAPAATEWLRPFERARKSENVMVQQSMSGFKWLFGQQLPPLVLARSFGMRMLNNLPVAKQLIMKQAMGL